MSRESDLIAAIKESGYYEYKDVNLDDLPSIQRSAIILAQEVQLFRPDLFEEDNQDIYFVMRRILENGSYSFDLPKRNLSELLKRPPFDDSSICSYSFKEEKVLKVIYKGTGTKWELVK